MCAWSLRLYTAYLFLLPVPSQHGSFRGIGSLVPPVVGGRDFTVGVRLHRLRRVVVSFTPTYTQQEKKKVITKNYPVQSNCEDAKVQWASANIILCQLVCSLLLTKASSTWYCGLLATSPACRWEKLCTCVHVSGFCVAPCTTLSIW